MTGECPTCGRDDFASEQGMKVHHARTHGESLVSYEETGCTNCGSVIEKHPSDLKRYDEHFCSNQCQYEHRNTGWVDVECSSCGVVVEREKWRVERYDNVFCSPHCHYQYQSEHREYPTGEEHPGWKGGVEIACERGDCNNVEVVKPSIAERTRFCSYDCHAKWMSETGAMAGENSPKWKGGRYRYYGPNWHKQRNKARERDNYECQSCGVRGDELDRQLDVHHKNPFRTFVPEEGEPDYEKANALSNLISLCPSCHQRTEAMAPLVPFSD